MRVAVTGGTGFIGRYLLRELLSQGYEVNAWFRHEESRTGILEHPRLHWVKGCLEDAGSMPLLLENCDAVVHNALWRPGNTFRGTEGDLAKYTQINLGGSLSLMEIAAKRQIDRFVYVSTCAVHEKIMDDRPLDETHPLWPFSHYGAHKAAVEKFVHSFAFGHQFPVCAIRPSGVYGVSHRISASKYYDLIGAIARGEDVECKRGGKEVHAADVARGITYLIAAPRDAILGEAFNCYDRYVSEIEVARIARDLSGSRSNITGVEKSPKHEIDTTKLRRLGMNFGGEKQLRKTVKDLFEAVVNPSATRSIQ